MGVIEIVALLDLVSDKEAAFTVVGSIEFPAIGVDGAVVVVTM